MSLPTAENEEGRPAVKLKCALEWDKRLKGGLCFENFVLEFIDSKNDHLIKSHKSTWLRKYF